MEKVNKYTVIVMESRWFCGCQDKRATLGEPRGKVLLGRGKRPKCEQAWHVAGTKKDSTPWSEQKETESNMRWVLATKQRPNHDEFWKLE